MKFVKELTSRRFWKCVIAEFVSTTLYSFIATSLCGSNDFHKSETSECSKASRSSELLLAATGIGLAVATLSYVFKTPYGCFMNPAVSFGQFTCWRNSFQKTFIVLLMQMAGGIAGVAVSYWIKQGHGQMNEDFSLKSVLAVEGIIGQLIPSFIIVMVVLISSNKSRKENGYISCLLYGLVSMMGVLIAGRHNECAINPARILGQAVILNRWSDPIWIYWIGSIGGGIVAGFFYQMIISKSDTGECKHRSPLFDSTQRVTRERSQPLISRPSKRKSSFWKKQEQIPFILDTLTKNSIV